MTFAANIAKHNKSATLTKDKITLERERQGEYLGKDANGYSYYRCVDHRIWQYAPDGKMVGWLCSVGAWERTMHTLIVEKP